jgi:hypothetical protein
MRLLMKRALVVLASASFIVAIGCKDYDIRLEKTLEERKYEKRLNENLEAAPTKGMLQGDSIFVRPPLGLEGPTQAFGLTGVEAGRFDIENSFIDQKKGASLHVVARIKKPKAAPSGKKAAAPVESATRGKFLDDVVELVKAAYSIEIAPGELKAEPHSHGNRVNNYKAVKKDLSTKDLEVYVYSESSGVHEVALIFEFPKDQKNFISPKIGHCLESLAVGKLAERFFEGATSLDVDAGGEMVAPAGQPPPI